MSLSLDLTLERVIASGELNRRGARTSFKVKNHSFEYRYIGSEGWVSKIFNSGKIISKINRELYEKPAERQRENTLRKRTTRRGGLTQKEENRRLFVLAREYLKEKKGMRIRKAFQPFIG